MNIMMMMMIKIAAKWTLYGQCTPGGHDPGLALHSNRKVCVILYWTVAYIRLSRWVAIKDILFWVFVPCQNITILRCYLYLSGWHLYRVSQEECARLRESVPYVKVYRYNPKHQYPKLNGNGDNGQRSLKLWQFYTLIDSKYILKLAGICGVCNVNICT